MCFSLKCDLCYMPLPVDCGQLHTCPHLNPPAFALFGKIRSAWSQGPLLTASHRSHAFLSPPPPPPSESSCLYRKTSVSFNPPGIPCLTLGRGGGDGGALQRPDPSVTDQDLGLCCTGSVCSVSFRESRVIMTEAPRQVVATLRAPCGLCHVTDTVCSASGLHIHWGKGGRGEVLLLCSASILAESSYC